MGRTPSGPSPEAPVGTSPEVPVTDPPTPDTGHDSGDEDSGDDQLPSQKVGFSGLEYADVQSENFEFKVSDDMPKLTPACLRNEGFELVILDPGHDDSNASRRSDAKERGGNEKYFFKWREVHEGQMAQVASYLAYEYLVSHPALSEAQRAELKTMIRFTRHPAEAKFGQYEESKGYGPKGGDITSGIDNRKARINTMITHHRPFDTQTQSWSKSKVWDVSNKAIFLSVHGNSTDYFEEGDHVWLIPAKGDSGLSSVQKLLNALKDGFSSEWGDYLQANDQDSAEVARLKNGSHSSVRSENIKTDEHSINLAVLSSDIKTQDKALLEGFVMNGKIGKLAYLDMTSNPKPKKLIFKQGSRLLKSYDVSDAYMAYAKSIARSLVERTNCR